MKVGSLTAIRWSSTLWATPDDSTYDEITVIGCEEVALVLRTKVGVNDEDWAYVVTHAGAGWISMKRLEELT